MGFIFETEIESILRAVRARTIGEEESITLTEVLAADIHPAIKAYFRADVQRMLQDERKEEVRSKKFPYALPEVVRLQSQIDLLLINFYEFNRSEFDGLLDHAVHFQFNYLCRPQWTLLGYMFENRRRTSANEIIRKFYSCIDYIYFKEIIKRHIENHGLAEVTYEEFKEFLKKIDHEIVAQHSSLELARLTRPIFSFVQAHLPHSMNKTIEEGATLPINAAIAFFEDKELEDVKVRLEEERDRHDVSEITIQRMADLIEKVSTGDEEARVSSKELPELLLFVAPEESLDQNNGGADQTELLVESTGDKKVVEEATQEGIATAQQQEESPSEGEIIFETAGDDVRQTNGAHLVDVHSLFTKSEQKMFVKKIFHKDEVAFRNALDELNKVQTWKEASHFLDQVFIANDIDPFSKDAIRFTDKIQSRYNLLNEPTE